ncbi:MAG: hypothetical protein QOJ99_5986 [Bryobacterales bacterium]|nr:hypothetical protein [Bryobacterales bacterium]
MTVGRAFMVVLIGIPAVDLQADFTYDQTSKITGGALIGMMKFAGAFSKDARKTMDPIQSTIAIKGNRMVHKTPDSATITDIDKETITHINYAAKTYSVSTFAQMKQAMDEMLRKTQKGSAQPAPDVSVDVKLRDTGQTKSINGNEVHEIVMTMAIQGKDAQSGARGGLDMVTDMWIAPNVAGYQEVRDYYRRMGEKLSWMPGTNPIMNRPDIARAMGEFYKEGSKLDGMPVISTMKVGGNVEGDANHLEQSQAQPPRAPVTTPSVSGALGAAIGGRFGVGGLGRRKKDDTTVADANPQAGGTNTSAPGSLMEMTMEVTRYSSASVDAVWFEVPSGFSQVQEDLIRSVRP